MNTSLYSICFLTDTTLVVLSNDKHKNTLIIDELNYSNASRNDISNKDIFTLSTLLHL